MSNSDLPELGTSTETETGFISGVTFGPKKVKYSVINGMAIFEGDIILGTVEEIRAFSNDIRRGIVRTGQRFRWPSGLVPFEIDPNMPNQERITGGPTNQGAIPHWEANTTIRFIRRTNANASLFPHFVLFANPSEPGQCSSRTGMQTGSQSIFVGQNCGEGNVIHEIGHAVGLWHEQSREDRDDFVSVNLQNVQQDQVHNFDQHITDGDDVGVYDYCSVMHYPSDAFSSNGQDTITVLRPQLLTPGAPCNSMIGQRNALSNGDMTAVSQMYGNRLLPRFRATLLTINNIVGLAGMYNPDDRRHVVVVGTNRGKVHEIYWKSDTVGVEGHDDLPVQFDRNSIVSVSGFYNIHDRRHVVVVGTNQGKVHEIYWKSDTVGVEGHDDLPVKFDTGNIIRLTGYYSTGDQLHNVIVGTSDGGLYSIYWRSEQVGVSGPYVLTPLPFASIAGLAGLYNSHDQRHIVIGGTSNGKIHELW